MYTSYHSTENDYRSDVVQTSFRINKNRNHFFFFFADLMFFFFSELRSPVMETKFLAG